jgi:hypothetical protein
VRLCVYAGVSSRRSGAVRSRSAFEIPFSDGYARCPGAKIVGVVGKAQRENFNGCEDEAWQPIAA